MRKAIAMIELIFAIVIMGIVMMSAPMLISTSTKSGYVALQQESIAAVSTEIGMILTHHWDDANTDENRSAPILLTNGDSGLNESTYADGNANGVRAGTDKYSKRNFITSTGERLSASTVLGTDAATDPNGNDDIDDFIGTDVGALNNVETKSTEEGDYIDRNITFTTNVTYMNDSPTVGTTYVGSGNSLTLDFNTTAAPSTTNIKRVSVILKTTLTDEEMAKEIILQAFSCNIGTFELEEEVY